MKIHHILLAAIFFLASCTKEKSTTGIGASSDMSANTNLVSKTDTFTVQQLLKQIDKKPQTFTLDATKDKTIEGKEGTRITISANSLVSEKTGKPVSGKVSLELTEYYKISDMLIANLSTTSDGKLLETGGMINIEAYANGEKLKLKDGSYAEIAFPIKKRKKGMQLFNGVWGENGVNWKLAKPFKEDICENTDTDALFPGGDEALIKYLQDNIKYPKSAKAKGIQGKVLCEFIIKKDGNLKAVRISKGVNKELNNEALRVIKKMPKWIAATQGGKPVNSRCIIPITFRIDVELNPDDANYTKRFEEKYKDESSFSESNTSESSYYIFKSTSLGFINCDRFVGLAQTTLNINTKKNENSQVIILFKKLRSFLNKTNASTSEAYRFENVPLGEAITILIIKEEKGKNYLAIKDTTITNKGVSNFDFKPVSLEVLKQNIEKLNN